MYMENSKHIYYLGMYAVSITTLFNLSMVQLG